MRQALGGLLVLGGFGGFGFGGFGGEEFLRDEPSRACNSLHAGGCTWLCRVRFPAAWVRQALGGLLVLGGFGGFGFGGFGGEEFLRDESDDGGDVQVVGG